MSIYAFGIPPNDNAFSPITWENTINDDWIEKIKKQAAGLESYVGGIVRDTSVEDVRSVRNVTCKTLSIEDDFTWLYDMLAQYVVSANNDYFKYNITGFMEKVQYLHYGEDIGGGHYDWHLDCGSAIATRKLTVIVQLSDPSEYEGCVTEIMFNNNVDQRKGAITVFPSWLPHRVTQLTKGNRDALVAWVNGPTFR